MRERIWWILFDWPFGAMSMITAQILLLIYSKIVYCRDITLLDCSCPRAFHPVCGTDGFVYDSGCFLDCARRYDQDLRLAYEGVCCPKAELCADYFDPVCDQYGNFYANDCIFDFHKCVQRRTSGKLLRVEGRGERMCGDRQGFKAAGVRQREHGNSSNNTGKPCEFYCEEIISPVCDSQGRTHKNRCKFDLASCRLRSRGIVSALHVIREGPCRKEEGTSRAISPSRMSLANLMESIRRERVRKKPNLPLNTNTSHEQPENTRKMQSSTPAMSGSLERSDDEEEHLEILSSKLFRDQQQHPMMMSNADRWILMQAHAEMMSKSASAEAMASTPALEANLPKSKVGERHREESPRKAQAMEKCPSLADCPDLWDPLCDTYNKTHANECRFSVARCEFARVASQSERFPQIAYRGKCTATSSRTNRPPMQCDFCRDEGPFEQIVPVCDNTNLTHQSICLFAQWNCDKRLRGVEEHVLAHIGECHLVSPTFELKDEVCPHKCSRHVKPVCDSNGLTHPNLCTYQMHSCHQRKASRPFGWLLSLRECENQTAKMSNNPSQKPEAAASNRPKQRAATIECPVEPSCEGDEISENEEPICDSDGRVYMNTCLFAHAHCLAAKAGRVLRIVDNKFCPQLHATQQQPASELSQSASCERKWPKCEGAPSDPYCGSDFVTYRNLCAIQKAQCLDNRVEILFKGECALCLAVPCPPLTALADDTQFVCDQSGETKSKCEFEMLRCIYEAKFGYNITAAYDGKCCPSAESCENLDGTLQQQNAAVCDSLGRRHSTRCLFEVAKCRAAKIGRHQLEERYCADTMASPPPMDSKVAFDRRPAEAAVQKPEAMEAYGGAATGVIRSDATTTTSTVEPMSLRNVSTELLSVNEMSCSDRYEPVCGSDGRTYRNGCHLERRNTSSSSNSRPPLPPPVPVRRLYSGECCPAPEECGPEYAPVCDDEGNTHLNLCEFGRQRCLAERIRAQNLTIVAYSICPGLRCPTEKCQSRYEPVCGTNGRTYVNLCELDKSVCVLRTGHRKGGNHTDSALFVHKQLALDYIGECCESAIECADQRPNMGEPVCDNLGRIYRDQCAFSRAACLAKKRDGQTLRLLKCPMASRRNMRRHRR